MSINTNIELNTLQEQLQSHQPGCGELIVEFGKHLFPENGSSPVDTKVVQAFAKMLVTSPHLKTTLETALPVTKVSLAQLLLNTGKKTAAENDHTTALKIYKLLLTLPLEDALEQDTRRERAISLMALSHHRKAVKYMSKEDFQKFYGNNLKNLEALILEYHQADKPKFIKTALELATGVEDFKAFYVDHPDHLETFIENCKKMKTNALAITTIALALSFADSPKSRMCYIKQLAVYIAQNEPSFSNELKKSITVLSNEERLTCADDLMKEGHNLASCLVYRYCENKSTAFLLDKARALSLQQDYTHAYKLLHDAFEDDFPDAFYDFAERKTYDQEREALRRIYIYLTRLFQYGKACNNMDGISEIIECLISHPLHDIDLVVHSITMNPGLLPALRLHDLLSRIGEKIDNNSLNKKFYYEYCLKNRGETPLSREDLNTIFVPLIHYYHNSNTDELAIDKITTTIQQVIASTDPEAQDMLRTLEILLLKIKPELLGSHYTALIDKWGISLLTEFHKSPPPEETTAVLHETIKLLRSNPEKMRLVCDLLLSITPNNPHALFCRDLARYRSILKKSNTVNVRVALNDLISIYLKHNIPHPAKSLYLLIINAMIDQLPTIIKLSPHEKKLQEEKRLLPHNEQFLFLEPFAKKLLEGEQPFLVDGNYSDDLSAFTKAEKSKLKAILSTTGSDKSASKHT